MTCFRIIETSKEKKKKITLVDLPLTLRRARKGGRGVGSRDPSLKIRASTWNLHGSVSPIIKGSRGSPGIPNDRDR